MNIALWAVQIILALVFLAAGFMKTFQTAKTKETVDWARESSSGYIRFIGIAEILGALGLVLPWALDIVPILTPVSAVGLGIIMLLAAILHAKRHEGQGIFMAFILLVLAAFVAYFRF